MEMIIHAFISSRLDYCNSLFTRLNKTSLHRLQTVQNAPAGILSKSTRRSHITPITSDLLQSCTSRRSLRSSGQRLLEVPCTRLRTRGDCAFQVVAPKLWNELPSSLPPLILRSLIKGR
ncbi:hypothetical protein LDENG_00094660 [Lucifuga dentata]|nr:hypothetical protein LDENG_00094660 [Lucifuga dentata]